MKKNLILIVLTISVLMIGSVLAVGTSRSIPLVQKNPSDWSIVNNGMKSTLYLYQSRGVRWIPCGTYDGQVLNCKKYILVNQFSLVPTGKVKNNTDYTLIYYGYGVNNDVWNYATCLGSGNSGKYGYLSLNGLFGWSSFLNDGINQKFWLVESSDVDCTNHIMTAWNPTKYLFETFTI